MSANKLLLVVLTSAVAIDGVLTTLVIHQHRDQHTLSEQVSLRTTPPASATMSNAAAHPDPATPAKPPNLPDGAAFPAPGSAGSVTLQQASIPAGPAVVAPAAPTPRKSPTSPHQRITPRPAAPPAAAPPLSAPLPITPATPAKPTKPGAPPGF
jgi:hypothetical protein